MPLTMLEAAKLSTNPLAQGIVEVFATNNPVLERLPFVDIAGGAYPFNLEDKLPGVAFRGVNETFTESTGVISQQSETLRIMGGVSDYDTFTIATTPGNDARATHDALKAKAMTLRWLKTFFDGEDDGREFDGVNKRITGNQLLDCGGALTLAKLDELIDAVQGTPDVLLMSKEMRRKVNALMRAAGQATEVVTDSFGRQIQAYAGIPIGIVEDDAEGNAILDFDEDDGSGNLDTASIYTLRFGPDGVHGIQNGAMDVRDMGLLENGVQYRTVVNWFTSFVIKHGKSVARLHGIKR